MKVEYKPNSLSAQWWVFETPADGLVVSEARSTRKGTSTLVALARAGTCLVAKFSKDVSGTVARTTFDTFARKSGLSGFGNPRQLDKVHLQSWGFYLTEREERAEEIAQGMLGATEVELREELDVFTTLVAEANQKASLAQAVGNVQEATKWTEEAARHMNKMSIASLKLRLLVPQACLTNGPEEESAKEHQLSLEDFEALTDARTEELVERIVEDGRMSIFEWLYGREDVLTVYIKPKMGHPQRLRYILSKNANPTPLEFAMLFMELSTSERIVEPGKNALTACLKAHKLHDASFDINALPEEVRKQYKDICDKSSGSGCAVCGKSVACDQVHCSKKCAENSCEACNGPVELKESSRDVLDQVSAGEIHSLKGILTLKSMKQPPSFLEQMEQYHPACKHKICCCAACGDCQEQHEAWTRKQEDWNQFGCKSEGWWGLQQARLDELQKQPEKKTIVERKRTCVAGCSGDERAAKRRRNEDDVFAAEQKRLRSMFGAEP